MTANVYGYIVAQKKEENDRVSSEQHHKGDKTDIATWFELLCKPLVECFVLFPLPSLNQIPVIDFG